MKIEIDDREFATVLAALRCYQAVGCGAKGTIDIATNGGEFEPLDEEEIDDLCEELNLGKRDAP
jgi:hypothetical protein